jgi:quercetin dioxygenase-like cupin family protein
LIRRNGELLKAEKTSLYGGSGNILLDHMLETDKGEFYNKGRLFSIITLPPGASIGYHVHTGEMECYHVLSGSAEYNDNNEEKTTISKGDTTVTLDGMGHSVENNTNCDGVFIALVLFTV